MTSQSQAERAAVLIPIFSDPETDGLDEAQLTDHLRAWIKANTVEGTLKSRLLVEPLSKKLIRHLIDLGLSDQQLFEHISELANDSSDEYRPWSPEYYRPISNREVQALAMCESWAEVIQYAQIPHPDRWYSDLIGQTFVPLLEDGQASDTDQIELGFSDNVDLRITEADWLRFRAEHGK